jgi:hypothetical protein
MSRVIQYRIVRYTNLNNESDFIIQKNGWRGWRSLSNYSSYESDRFSTLEDAQAYLNRYHMDKAIEIVWTGESIFPPKNLSEKNK